MLRLNPLLLAALLCAAQICAAAPHATAARSESDEALRVPRIESSAQTSATTRSLLNFASDTKSMRSVPRLVERFDEAVAARTLPSGGHIATLAARDLIVAKPGEVFLFAAPNRNVIRLRTEKLDTHAADNHVWIGVDDTDSAAPQRAFISIVNGAISGFVQSRESHFELVDAASLAVTEDSDARSVYVLDYAALGQSRAYGFGADAIAPPPLAQRPLWMQEEARAARAAAEKNAELKAAPSPQSTIDVMVAYTGGMVTRHGNASGVVARINTLISFANTSYTGSDVAITLRLVHSVQVSYPDGGDNGTALNELTGSNGSTSVTIPASLSGLAALRNTYGADLVALLRPYQNSSHGGCGVAWIGGFNVTNIGDDSPFGFSVTSSGSDTGGGGFSCSDSAFAHELGHNMGLMHDRANATNGSGVLQRGATPYAYGYTIPSTDIGDIMSYANQESPRFSSPSLGCSGTNCTMGSGGSALGVAANTPQEACLTSSSGCIASQASACTTNSTTCADAARALNFTRVKVSEFRPTATSGGSPSIAGSATLSSGGNVTQGTQLCFNGSSAVSACSVGANGQFNCTVPSNWTGTVHLQAGNSNRVAAVRIATGVTSALSGQNFVVSPSALFTCNLDIDNNGLNEPNTDGVMILRKLFGVTGTAQLTTPSTVCAQRTNQTDMLNYLNARSYNFNSGGLSSQQEGLLLLRLMLGVPGSTAVNGTGLAWTSVQAFVNSSCGTSF